MNFSLEYIDDVPYLVPFGQAVSSGAKAVKLNPTGAIMWEKLNFLSETQVSLESSGSTLRSSSPFLTYPLSDSLKSAWLSALYTEFEATTYEDRAVIERDALDFAEMLHKHQVFSQTAYNNTINEDNITKEFSIAGLHMTYTGPTRLYPDDFNEFALNFLSEPQASLENSCSGKRSESRTSTASPGEPTGNFCASIDVNVSGILTRSYPLGTPVIKTRDVCIFKVDYGYFILFDTFSVIRECELHTDGKVNLFYHIPSVKNSGKCIHAILNDIDYETGVYETFHAMRFAFLFFSQLRGVYALHSASFLYREKLWLVSAPAGTGKSTHAALWNKCFGTPVINGDLNCIDTNDVPLYVKGTPWCGTSGIFDANTYPLGGIILLSRGRENIITAATEDQLILAVANRFISPSWTADMLKKNIEASTNICKNALVFQLACDMSDNAAAVCRDYIDRSLT